MQQAFLDPLTPPVDVNDLATTVSQLQQQADGLNAFVQLTAQVPVPPAATSAASTVTNTTTGSAQPTFATPLTIFNGSYTATQEATQTFALGAFGGASAVYVQARMGFSSGGAQQLQVQSLSGQWYNVTDAISGGNSGLVTMWVPTVAGNLLWRINATGAIGGTLNFVIIAS